MSTQSSGSLKRLNYLLGEIDGTYHEVARKLGVSDSVSKILYTICDTDGGDRCPLHEICRQTGLSKQTVNSALRGLEREGLIYLRAVDGKAKEVCLTEPGKAFAEKTARQVIQIENDILEDWTPEELEIYLKLTERYLAQLAQKAEQLPQRPGLNTP